jgi:hypothetical protein
VTPPFAGTSTFIAVAPVPTRSFAAPPPVLCATTTRRPSVFAKATCVIEPPDTVEATRTAPGRTHFAKCASA